MFKLNPVIDNPKKKYAYKKYLKEKEEKLKVDEEKKKELELKEEMKKRLSKEEYNKWQGREYYYKNRERINQRDKDKRLAKLKMNLEEYEELAEDYPLIKTEREKELELLEKYKNDFVNKYGRFVQYWWCSPIWYKYKKMRIFSQPIKVIPNPGIEKSITNRLNIQNKVYEFVKPHINEIHKNEYAPKEKQEMFNKLQYTFKPNTKIFELHQAKGISQNVLAMIVDAMLRDKYINTVPYLGICILCGDRVYTSMGQIFMISPYNNNYKYINEENIDKIHEDTNKFLKKESYGCAMAIAYYCYLIKIPRDIYEVNEGEKEITKWNYYVVPYRARRWEKIEELSYDLFYKYW